MSTPRPLTHDFVALSLTPFSWRRGLGPRLRAGDSPDGLIRALAPESPDARALLERLPGMTRAAVERAHAGAIRVVPWNDPHYPAALAVIDEPPPVLWLKGDVAALGGVAVAVVGSRAGGAYATTVAESLATDLASHGVVVVSGLARGVDSAAHRGALAAGGGTVAVLGSGVDVIYPPEQRPAAERLAVTSRSALVSELAPGTRPLQWFFPLRNRIISGLSRAVVVVEAGEKSGSLITARYALDQGREVLAVPGSVIGGRNRGGHSLIKDGAKIVESADDILDELGLRGQSAHQEAHDQVAERPRCWLPGLAPHDPILGAWPAGEERELDEISAQSGLESARLLPRLFELELRGLVRRAGGGRFIRLDRSC